MFEGEELLNYDRDYLNRFAMHFSVLINQIVILWYLRKKDQWPKEKGQTTIYKTLHRKLKIEQNKPH